MVKEMIIMQLFLATLPVVGQTPPDPNLDTLFDAIAFVESGNDPNAVGDGGLLAVGMYQIHPVFVEDVNRILKKEAYTLADRWNPIRCREMLGIWFRHYLKYWSLEKCIRFYNAGNKWESPAAGRYYKKIMKGIQKEK